MKNLHDIHLTPEQRSSQASAQSMADLEMGVGGLHQDLLESIEQTKELKSQFSAELDSMISEVVGAVHASPEQAVHKLEELKSAVLVANRLLKKIAEATSREPVPFPEIPKTDLSETNRLLGELAEEIKKPCHITLKLK